MEDNSLGFDETSHLVGPHEASMESSVDAEDGFASRLRITLTVEDALEAIGDGKFQYAMIIYAGLAWLADAAEMILLSFIGPAAKCEWGLSATQEGAITSAVFLGLFFGTYCWGFLADFKGRKASFLATVIFTVAFGLLSAWSPSFIWLLVSRSLVGFGLGGSAVAFNLCMEFLPPSKRGFWLVFLEVFWTAGSVIEALLSWIIIPHWNWRLLVAVSALPFVLLLIFYPSLPESPRYLLVKGDADGALAVLRRVARVNKKELPEGTLILSRSPQATSPSSRESDHIPVIADGTAVIKPKSQDSQKQGFFDTLRPLFSQELRLTTVLLWLSFFANSFAYYGLVLLTTQLSNGEQQCNQTTGEPDADNVFCLSDGKPNIDSWTYKEVLVTSFAELPGLLIACLTIERIGRKATMMALLFGCAAFLIPLYSSLPNLPTTVLLFGGRACIMGSFSVLWAFAPELYPTKVRSTALGFANGGNRLGGFVCPYAAVGLIEKCHRVLAVALFSGVSVLAGAAAIFFPVETKGLKLSDDVT